VLQVGWPVPIVVVTLAALSGGSDVGAIVVRAVAAVLGIVVIALAVRASAKSPGETNDGAH
jgi:hypothetical protein